MSNRYYIPGYFIELNNADRGAGFENPSLLLPATPNPPSFSRFETRKQEKYGLFLFLKRYYSVSST
ncbi:MAG: hypothetical protein LBP50_01410 [Tannerella sp.]|jgi:hypothetical protein|nr:hypothetical protein [Tannerella sp.]